MRIDVMNILGNDINNFEGGSYKSYLINDLTKFFAYYKNLYTFAPS